MKTLKDVQWDKETGFGAVEFDNGLCLALTVVAGPRPYQGLVFPVGSRRVEDAKAFDFATEQSLNRYMAEVQQSEQTAA